MTRATLLYGEQNLLDEYNNHVAEKLYEKSPETKRKPTSVGFTRGIRQMEEDIETYDPFYSYFDPVEGSLFGSKKDFHRVISLLLTDLGLVFDIRSPSPWQVISKLQNRKIFSETNSTILKVCLSIANEIRLKTYFANGGQKELFSPVRQIPDTTEQSTDDPIFRDFDENTLVHLMSTNMDLHRRCRKFCLEYFYRDKVNASILQKQFFPSKALVRFRLYFRLQKPNKAWECLKSIPKDSPEYVNCVHHEGRRHQSKGKYKKAIECYKTALEHSQDPFQRLSYQCHLADTLCKNYHFKEGRDELEEAMKLHDEIHGEGSETKSLVKLLLTRAVLFYGLYDFPSAIKTLQRGEEIQKQITRGSDMNVIDLNIYMALSYSMLCQNDQSLHYLEKALCLSHKIFGEHNLSYQLGMIYAYAAHIYHACGRHNKASLWVERNLKLLESLHDDTPNKGKIVEG